MGARTRKTPVKKKKKAAGKKAPARKRTKAAAAAPRAKPRGAPARAVEPPAPPRRFGLALAADWAGGAFLAGALDHLHRKGRLEGAGPVAGSGSGALVAALVALGKWDVLQSLFLELTTRRLVTPRHNWLPRGAARFLLSTVTNTQSLCLADEGLHEIVRAHVDPEALKTAPFETIFVAADFQTGAARPFSSRHDEPDDLLTGLVAAASRPVTLPLVRLGYVPHQHADGALLGHAPLAAVFAALRREDAPVVEAVLALSTDAVRGAAHAGAYTDIAEVLERALDLASTARRRSDLRMAHVVNAILALRESLGGRRFAAALAGADAATRAEVERQLRKRRLPVLPIQPDAPLPASGLACDPATNRAAFAAGAAAAARAFEPPAG